MRNSKTRRFDVNLFSLLFGTSIFLCSITACAQNIEGQKKGILLPPSKEIFEPVSDLAVPWRNSGCINLVAVDDAPNCLRISGDEHRMANYFRLYEPDGTVWFGFSLNSGEPEYISKKNKPEFVPLSKDREEWPKRVILRMVGESEHWYEVEVNEQTRATKFILKSEPRMWAKVTWEYAILNGRKDGDNYIYTDENRELLRDGPDGKIKEERDILDTNRLMVLKVDGDWAYVFVGDSSAWMKGWIRWRNGREFLVGTVFNGYKIPVSSNNIASK
jgi:hypothetical protein